MESQLVSNLRAELDASRRQNEHICTQVQALCMEFGLYRKATQVKLSELRQHKRMLEGKVMGLQEKLGASDGKEKTAAAQDEMKNGRHLSTSDDDATPGLKRIEEQTRAQDQHAHEINVQWESPLLDREIAAAIDSYASEVAASVNGYDGGSMTPSAAAIAPIDSSHPRQSVKDEQRHQQAGDSQQRLPNSNNSSNNTNQGPSLGPFYPAPLPVALGGQSGKRQGSLKRLKPRRKPESRKFSSKDAKVVRKRTHPLRRVSHSGAPDGTRTHSEGSLP